VNLKYIIDANFILINLYIRLERELETCLDERVRWEGGRGGERKKSEKVIK